MHVHRRQVTTRKLLLNNACSLDVYNLFLVGCVTYIYMYVCTLHVCSWHAPFILGVVGVKAGVTQACPHSLVVLNIRCIFHKFICIVCLAKVLASRATVLVMNFEWCSHTNRRQCARK